MIAACGGGQPTATKSTELNLYAWSEYIPQTLLDNFTTQTGIKVNYDTYSSNEELMAKLQAGASGYDVIIPSDYMVSILNKQGLLEKLDMAQIPNFKNIDDRLKNQDYDPGNQFTVPYQWGTSCLVVDTSKVTRPITKWADLWDPEFAGKVVLLDDEREVIGMVLEVLGYDKNSTDPAQLEEAKTKLSELMPNVKLFDSDSPKPPCWPARSGWDRPGMARPLSPTAKTRPSTMCSQRKVARSGLTTWQSRRAPLTSMQPMRSSTSCWTGRTAS